MRILLVLMTLLCTKLMAYEFSYYDNGEKLLITKGSTKLSAVVNVDGTIELDQSVGSAQEKNISLHFKRWSDIKDKHFREVSNNFFQCH